MGTFDGTLFALWQFVPVRYEKKNTILIGKSSKYLWTMASSSLKKIESASSANFRPWQILPSNQHVLVGGVLTWDHHSGLKEA